MKKIIFTTVFLFFLTSCSMQKQNIVSFFKGNKKITEIIVEIADTPKKIMTGLMHRKHLEENYGMLFIFPGMKTRSFWMKNMNFPIDIIYADKDKHIVSAVKKAPPCNEKFCPSYSSRRPAKYVIETVSGFFDLYNLDENTTINISLADKKH